MKAMTVKRNMMSKFIIVEFVKGNLNTQEDVNNMINVIMNKLGLNRIQAGYLIKESISNN